MRKVNLLDLITANPVYKRLATHLFLLILWRPFDQDSSDIEAPESFDEGFFDRVVRQVGETSPLLADVLRKKLGIYQLEAGSLAAHQEYFSVVARGFAEDDSQRPTVLEALLQTLEADASYDGTRPCPGAIIQLIASISQQAGGCSYYDPNGSSGRLLAELVANSSQNAWGLGQSTSDEDILHGLLRAFFHHGSLRFQKADALVSPPIDGEQLQAFDVVVSDLSAGADTFDPELVVKDTFGRFRYGAAPKGKSEWLFIQHMLACMHQGHGLAIAVVDLAALLRAGKELDIRRAIIESNRLDAVIYLPPKIYRSDSRTLAILVFKSSRQSHPVLLVDGRKLYTSGKSLNTLTQAGIQQMLELYARRDPNDDDSVLLSIAELESNGFALNPGRYFSARADEGLPDIDALSREHENLKRELLDVGAQIDELLGRLAG